MDLNVRRSNITFSFLIKFYLEWAHRNDTDLWQKNYDEMNEASFSKLTSDKNI